MITDGPKTRANVNAKAGPWNRLHVWHGLAAALLLTLVGFWPSFFAKFGTTDRPHMVHGISATLWMIAVVWQARLAATRRTKLHRLMGWGLLILPPVLIGSGLQMIAIMVRDPRGDLLARYLFAYVDVILLGVFGLCVIAAIAAARRRDIPLHQRWMTGTALIALEPALERLFLNVAPALVPNWRAALNSAFGCVELILLALLIAEWRSGRVHRPYVVLLVVFGLIHITVWPVATNPTFQDFAHQLADLWPA